VLLLLLSGLAEVFLWACSILMFSQNLITKAPSANLPAMLVAQLLPFSKNLSTRKWSDEDILEDVQYVRDELERNFDSLTWVYLILLQFLAD
jgi:hypothetical protein